MFIIASSPKISGVLARRLACVDSHPETEAEYFPSSLVNLVPTEAHFSSAEIFPEIFLSNLCSTQTIFLSQALAINLESQNLYSQPRVLLFSPAEADNFVFSEKS